VLCHLNHAPSTPNHPFFEIEFHFVAEAGLELRIILSPPPESWDYRCASSHLTSHTYLAACPIQHIKKEYQHILCSHDRSNSGPLFSACSFSVASLNYGDAFWEMRC
jgi:hypothetical protein